MSLCVHLGPILSESVATNDELTSTRGSQPVRARPARCAASSSRLRCCYSSHQAICTLHWDLQRFSTAIASCWRLNDRFSRPPTGTQPIIDGDDERQTGCARPGRRCSCTPSHRLIWLATFHHISDHRCWLAAGPTLYDRSPVTPCQPACSG